MNLVQALPGHLCEMLSGQGNLRPREAGGEGDRQGQEGHAALQDAESTFLLITW